MPQQRPEAIALISGGKDSLLSLYHAIANGYNVVALGNLHPPTSAAPSATYTTDESGTTLYLPSSSSTTAALGPAATTSDELDSYMYQTIGHTLLPLYATCLNLPLYRRAILGGSVNTTLDYRVNEGDGDETEDLTQLLRSVMERHPNVVAVTSGAILSTYQRTRIESVCSRLGLMSLAFLWQMQQEDVLMQLSTLEFDAKIVKVAALGLNEEWLWGNVADAKVRARLQSLKERWGINVAGEGGEYETLVVDAPGWRGRIEVPEEARVVVKEGGGAAWVGFKEAVVVNRKGRGQEEWAHKLLENNIFDPEFQALLESLPDSKPPAPGTEAANDDDDTQLSPRIITTQNTIHISNLVSPLPTASLAEELTAIFTHLTTLISPHPLTAITSITLLLRDMSSFTAINTLYSPHFPLPLPPSRVCISVPGLPRGRNIMLSASLDSSANAAARKGLHVQSRSYWAPANIGPYSQAVLNNGWWEVAGQIPLVPASMQLVERRREQATLALQHLERIWNVVGATGKAAVAWVVCEAMVKIVVNTWQREGPVMIVQATALPRGAEVEWVGFGVDTQCEEEGTVEMVFVDCTTAEEAASELASKVMATGGEVVIVYLPVCVASVQAFLKCWKGDGAVGVVPVGVVWDGQGRRRTVGCVVKCG